jgi:hypothetical protein
MARPTNFMIALRQLVREEVRQLLEQFMTRGNHRKRRRGSRSRRQTQAQRAAPAAG